MYNTDDYIVLLTDCSGGNGWSHSIPVYHCYQLSAFLTKYHMVLKKDINGHKNNGWSINPNHKDIANYSKLTYRPATKKEIDEYKRLDGPFNVSELKVKVKEDKSHEKHLKKLLKEFIC